VVIRAPREDDLAAVAGLLATRPDVLRSEWELPSFDPAQDAWVAEEDGAIVGYAAVIAGERLVLVGPDTLLDTAARRARDKGFGQLKVTTEGDPGHPGVELAQETLVLTRPLDDPVAEPDWPDGLAARTFEPADAETVHALLDAAYRAWDSRYVPLAHDDWLRWMTGDSDFDPTVWWLAERDGELVGCALHWRTGFLKDLAVRESERGRGLGAALVQQGLAEFARRGVERVRLKVDAANPTGAVRLYERLGFVLERREAIWAFSL
jgi:ribosomal protein S18 acetylase RimI-like enzyme